MKIIIIRHAEPDYELNTLTLKGYREVELLKKYYEDKTFDMVYSSPLPRSLYTAYGVVKDKQPIYVKPWLKEFIHHVLLNDQRRLNWDFMPSYLNENQDLYLLDKYLETDLCKSANLKEEYEEVTNSFDEVLKSHGYERKGIYYQVNEPNDKTIVFVCHLGMMSVLMSHLCHIPYLVIAQHFYVAPTGVTILYSEEREKGIAQFRLREYGNVNHLDIANEPISLKGAFIEMQK